MSSESLGQAVANNTNWINSVISNSKLSSQLAELASIDSLDQKIVVQEGVLDAKYANAKTIRGYKGNWEADTNNPVLSNSSGVVGDIYKVSIGGNINIGSGSIDYVAGDLVYLSEDNWIKISPNQISDITGLQLALDSLADGLIPQGTWNASTNDPDIDGGIAETGYFWIVSIAGTTDVGGITDWEINDWAVKTATGWAKIDNTDKVLSVAGRTGVIVLSITDITGLTSALANCVKLTGDQSIAGEKTFTEVVIMTDRLDLSDSTNNSFIGNSTGLSNTTGATNVGLGNSALYSNTTGSTNVGIGSSALYSNTTGGSNVGIGLSALYSNTTGTFNIALGQGTLADNIGGNLNIALGIGGLRSNTTGGDNISLGYDTLGNNTTGSYNVGLGYKSGLFIADGSANTQCSSSIFIGKEARANGNNQTNQIVIGGGAVGNGSNTVTLGNDSIATTYLKGIVVMTDRLDLSDSLSNSFIGEDAGVNNTTGIYNVSLGYKSLYSNTVGNRNLGLGNQSLYYNTEGDGNVALGISSLQDNTTGDYNIALGYQSLLQNTTGGYNVALGAQSLRSNTGSFNIALGISALYNNTTANSNIALGHSSLIDNTTGLQNVALGFMALGHNTTGGYNIGFGTNAGKYALDGATSNTTGEESIFIGRNTRANANGEINQIVIGGAAIGKGSNTVTLGNDNIATTYLKGDVNITGTITGVGGEFLPLIGGTLTGALTGTSATFAGTTTVQGTGDSSFVGNVGIGTATFDATYDAKLQVTSSASDGTGGILIENYLPTLTLLDISGGASASQLQQDGTNMVFKNSGSEKMRIDSDGNVGIGTASPDTPIDVSSESSTIASFRATGGASNNKRLEIGTGGDRIILKSFTDTTDVGAEIAFSNGNSEAMRIDTNGNVGIGTDSPDAKLEVIGETRISYAPSNQYRVRITNSDGNGRILVDGDTSSLIFGTSGAGANATATERMRITSGGNVTITGSVTSSGLDISSNDPNIRLTDTSFTGAVVDIKAESSANEVADMVFFTRNTGTPTEKMRITSGGNVLFGTEGIPNGTSVYGSGFITSSSDRSMLYQASSIATSINLQAFFNSNGLVGTISTNGSSTSYNTSSDYRLKEDLKDFNGLEKVSKISVYDYKWKTDESRSYGVMAHELQEVLPDAVTGEKDAEEMQGVDYSKIVPLLIKSIQELKAEIDILKAK